jgi:hypothetical protein
MLTGVYTYAQLKLKVDTMWAFQMRRAETDAVGAGVARLNSPLVFEPQFLSMFHSLRDELVEFGQHYEHLKQLDFLVILERHFGDALVHSVCLPSKMPYGVCLLAAMQVALRAEGGLALDLSRPDKPTEKVIV